MTNGEKIIQAFPDLQIDMGELEVYMWTTIHDAIDIPLEWWNAEYKEPTTKNCRSCRNFGTHHGICEICKDNKCWTEKEPTADNDSAVDTNKLLETCEKMSFDFELFGRPTKALLLDAVKNIVNDLLRATPQEPKPMVEIDLYSVIKQKYIEREVLDKIRAEIVELTKCPYGTECLGANCPSNTDCMICGDHVLEIIDKYKGEIEPQEKRG